MGVVLRIPLCTVPNSSSWLAGVTFLWVLWVVADTFIFSRGGENIVKAKAHVM